VCVVERRASGCATDCAVAQGRVAPSDGLLTPQLRATR